MTLRFGRSCPRQLNLALFSPASYWAAPRQPPGDISVIQKELGSGVTIFQVAPQLLEALINNDGFISATSLKRIFCGGDRLSTSIVNKFVKQCEASLVNLYGPTEAAIDVTAWSCPDTFDGPSVPIGRPISNTRIYLLDGHGRPVPLGSVGEIYIGGAGVARGYLNRPELTAEKFIPSPFVGGDRLYKTGDLARYLPDGNLEFLGRNDHQVKIRGFRIELGEIEARLLEHPAVREGGGPGPRGCGRRQAAGGLCGGGWRRDRCGGVEGASGCFCFPSTTWSRRPMWRLQALPLTPNGKLDRQALRAGFEDDAYARASLRAAARRGRRDPGGDLGRTLGRRPDQPPRQLLRARRTLAAGRADGQPAAGRNWASPRRWPPSSPTPFSPTSPWRWPKASAANNGRNRQHLDNRKVAFAQSS